MEILTFTGEHYFELRQPPHSQSSASYFHNYCSHVSLLRCKLEKALCGTEPFQWILK